MNLQVQMGRRAVGLPAVVTERLGFDLILGQPFLAECGVVLDFGEETASSAELGWQSSFAVTEAVADSRRLPACSLQLRETLALAPDEERRVTMKVGAESEVARATRIAFLTDRPEVAATGALRIGKSVARICDGEVNVWIKNTSSQNVVVDAGASVAAAQPTTEISPVGNKGEMVCQVQWEHDSQEEVSLEADPRVTAPEVEDSARILHVQAIFVDRDDHALQVRAAELVPRAGRGSVDSSRIEERMVEIRLGSQLSRAERLQFLQTLAKYPAVFCRGPGPWRGALVPPQNTNRSGDTGTSTFAPNTFP